MVLSMGRWKGKVAIITGASSGIGAAVAENLVKEGLLVVGVARRSEIVEQLSCKLKGQPGKLFAFKGDVAKQEDIIAAFKWTGEKVGPVHILINNAGVAPKVSIHDGDTEVLRSIMDINLMAVTLCSKEAIKVMQKRGIGGHIVNICSIAGHYPVKVEDTGLYAASKFAVKALTETLRQELIQLKSKIKVTNISPGLVDTKLVRMEGRDTSWLQGLPVLAPEDIADAIHYALSTPPHTQVHEIIIRPLGETM